MYFASGQPLPINSLFDVQTCFTLALQRGDSKFTLDLASVQAIAMSRDKHGNTALHSIIEAIEAEEKKLLIIQALLKHPNSWKLVLAKNCFGLTVLDVALLSTLAFPLHKMLKPLLNHDSWPFHDGWNATNCFNQWKMRLRLRREATGEEETGMEGTPGSQCEEGILW